MPQALDLEKSKLLLEVEKLLYRLRISGTLIGFRYLSFIICVVVEEPYLVQLMTKRLYPLVAKEFQTSSRAVEHAIRHAIRYAWLHGGQAPLSEIVGYPIEDRLSNGEFIDLVSAYIRHNLSL